jgi:hypothetical protein
MQIISRLNIFIVLRCISFYLRVRQSQRHRCIHYCKKLWMLIWLADIQGNLVTMCVELYHAQGVSISRSFKFNRISNENNTTTINHIREIIRPYYWLVNVIWKRPTGFTPSPPLLCWIQVILCCLFCCVCPLTVSCVQHCLFLWTVHIWWFLWSFLTFIIQY